MLSGGNSVIDKIVKTLKKHSLLIEMGGLEHLPNWQGKMRTDNRKISAGDIFVCIKGEFFDGHSYIKSALEKGAALIVGEEFNNPDFPFLKVKDSRKAAALIARLIFLPEKIPFTLIGITGTNGKTTTSLMIYEALKNLGFRCGWIGTLGYYINDNKFPSERTTPDIIELNEIFAEIVKAEIKYVVMEVSSHSLALNRVYGVKFDYCLFSNLGRDHLDFHQTLANYGKAKMSFFKQGVKDGSISIINTADPFGDKIEKMLIAKQAKVHSIGGNDAEFSFADIKTDIHNSSFKLISADAEIFISSRLIGSFNIQNLGLSALTLYAMGFSPEQIHQSIKNIPPVSGRIEKVENDFGIGIFIDYAHTPEAIENVLKAVKDLPHKRILCLLGAGGDRDKGKRPLMLKAALQYCNAVIISDDNPRSENPDTIIKDIVADSDLYAPWWVIRERKQAIESLICIAGKDDIVLFCGKGSEDYQEIEGTKHHFNDRETILAALASKSSYSKAEDEFILPVDQTLLKLLFLPENNPEPKGYRKPVSYKYISTDSRNIKPGSIFIAIKGEKYDGHNYLPEVLAHKENCAIGEKPLPTDISAEEFQYFQVQSSMQAMGNICRKYLQLFPAKRIALTGSTGKTTTKEFIAQVLESSASVLKTRANENNMIGLCKTILRILPEHQYAVFELGTNHFGEISALAEVVNPEIGIIINIGPAHLESFYNEEGVFQEKINLFKRPLALRLFPGDNPRFKPFARKGIGVGYKETCNYRITQQQVTENRQTFYLNEDLWILPYSAPYYAINAAFAIVLGLKLGIDKKKIQSALKKPIQLDLRTQIIKRGTGLLIIDCYNANPVSMINALKYWQSLYPEKPHYAILADMLELGSSTSYYHDLIGSILAKMRFEKLYTVGSHSVFYHSAKEGKITHFYSVKRMLSSLYRWPIPQDAVILLKGSHYWQLELLIPKLKGEN